MAVSTNPVIHFFELIVNYFYKLLWFFSDIRIDVISI